MSRFLDLINGKPESPAPVAAPVVAPVAKVVVEKPKVVAVGPKVEKVETVSDSK
jgi:hypothetical protein